MKPILSLQTKVNLKIAIGGDWGGREAHLFNIETENAKLTPNLEVNIPYSYNARVAGTFIEDDNGLALAHRGKFNAFRGAIPKALAMEHFKDNVVKTHTKADVLLVTYLNSPSFADDIASFIINVINFKTAYKSGNLGN